MNFLVMEDDFFFPEMKPHKMKCDKNSNTISICAQLGFGIRCCRDRMKRERYLLDEVAVKDQKRGCCGGKEGLQITVQVRSRRR